MSSQITASSSLTDNQQLFEVKKAALGDTRITTQSLRQRLGEDEVLLKVDKFALTANNISYGVAGDALGYWRFFMPNNQPDNSWGRLPVMGYGDVIASNCQSVAVGERVWGFFPMASHLKITAGKCHAGGFSDISAHREGLSPLYSAFERTSQNPFYQVENEAYDILLRGLFTTSWLVDDFMADNDYFDAQQYLITSASSKTSIALAFAIKSRGKMPSIGITSAHNKAFVTSLGCYDHIVSYDEITQLAGDKKSILVDMAGSQRILSAVHHHFSDQLAYSCRIGMTHHSDQAPLGFTGEQALPGAAPTFFFAPSQLKKRSTEWGALKVMQSIGLGLADYINFSKSFLTIEHTTDIDAIDGVYQRILAGTADASIGQIITM